MHLAIPFTLLMGSFVAAAPSIQHAQINVEIPHTDTQNQADALQSSEELVMNLGGAALKNLPFNFTLSARYANGGPNPRLPFGFENLDVQDFVRGELGFTTEFAFYDGKLINGNLALGRHPTYLYPPWTTLWPLKREKSFKFWEFIAISKSSGGRQQYFLELVKHEEIFGAYEIAHGEPVFVGAQDLLPARLLLTIEPIRKSSDIINADSAEELR